jgi:hypothetical protein
MISGASLILQAHCTRVNTWFIREWNSAHVHINEMKQECQSIALFMNLVTFDNEEQKSRWIFVFLNSSQEHDLIDYSLF